MTCLDIGTEWIPELKKVVSEYNIPDEIMEYVEGSTSDLPFPDESFDFVASNGVIMHLENEDHAKKALKELSRVTSKGGCLFVYSGMDRPGIMDKYILPTFRKAYSEDKDFKSFIDNIDHEKVNKEIINCLNDGRNIDSSIPDELIKLIPSLFTLDTTTFLQNVLQVPNQQGPKLDFEWVKNALLECGFKKIKRIPDKYWKRNDLRKFLAPFHYYREYKISKLIYGGGHVKVVAQKENF